MLEQTNFGEVRGPDWKAWEDKTFPSRDIPSHEASKCAGLQGEEPFARYHLALHRAKHQQKLDITNQLILRDIALQAGLDVARWEEDMKSGAAIPLIAQDQDRLHDALFSGPDCAPTDEAARRRFFGED